MFKVTIAGTEALLNELVLLALVGKLLSLEDLAGQLYLNLGSNAPFGNVNSFKNRCNDLLRRGLIARVGDMEHGSRYKLTDDGRKVLQKNKFFRFVAQQVDLLKK